MFSLFLIEDSTLGHAEGSSSSMSFQNVKDVAISNFKKDAIYRGNVPNIFTYILAT